MQPLRTRARVSLLVASKLTATRPPARQHLLLRQLHTTPRCRTDGVYPGLTDSRMMASWIDALEQKKREDADALAGLHKQPHQVDMTPKRMRDSFTRVVVPLSRDKYLADNYLNASGRLRLGPIFMDLDALSGIITYKHTGEGVTNVTAAVDRITIDHPLTDLCDLEYTGQVTYAKGSSSMEVTCRVARARPEDELSKPEDTLLTITFTLVSLNPTTKKSTPNPPLEVTSDAERAIYKLGESRSKAKRALAKQSLREHHPNDTESALTHKIWMHKLATQDEASSTAMPATVTPMSKTRLHSALIMQPQYRNRHNFVIFGGFLLKQTYELAFCCAASFAHAKPTFVSADPCTFLHPVPVGSVLYLTATVVYCDPPLIDVDTAEDSVEKNAAGKTRVSVRVDSRVRDVEHGAAKPTGQFHYTFTVDRDVKVLPETYQEHMVYLDGRRRAMAYVGEAADESAAKLTHADLTE